MSVRCPGKLAWPELLGVNGRTAATTIESENPYVRAFILFENTPVPGTFSCNRVWVFVNIIGRVDRVPVVG